MGGDREYVTAVTGRSVALGLALALTGRSVALGLALALTAGSAAASPPVASAAWGERRDDPALLHSRWLGGASRLALGPGSGSGLSVAAAGDGRVVESVAAGDGRVVESVAATGDGRVVMPVAGGARDGELRTGLGLGLGLVGAASLGLGVGLLVQHRRAYARFEAAPDNAGFVAALTASEVGSGLVGAGLGFAASALGEALGLKERGRWAELVVGGGLALVGAAWVAREWPQVQRDLYEGGSRPDGGFDAGALHREAAAAALLGAGVGLAAGAGVALLTRLLRGSRARRTAARWGMVGNRGGLGLGGRF